MAEGDKPKVTFRIDSMDAAPILLMAGLFDIISVIPLANDVNVFVAQPLLFLAFLMRGVNPLGPKNWVWFLVAWIVELIPGLSIFPTFVVESMRWIAISRVEDEVKARIGVDADSKLGRTFGRKFLAQKQVQEAATASGRNSAAYDARQARKEGNSGREAIDKKNKRIASAKTNLDAAVAPEAKNVSSGRERVENQMLASAGRARARERDQRLGAANDNTPAVDGVLPNQEAA